MSLDSLQRYRMKTYVNNKTNQEVKAVRFDDSLTSITELNKLVTDTCWDLDYCSDNISPAIKLLDGVKEVDRCHVGDYVVAIPTGLYDAHAYHVIHEKEFESQYSVKTT